MQNINNQPSSKNISQPTNPTPSIHSPSKRDPYASYTLSATGISSDTINDGASITGVHVLSTVANRAKRQLSLSVLDNLKGLPLSSSLYFSRVIMSFTGADYIHSSTQIKNLDALFLSKTYLDFCTNPLKNMIYMLQTDQSYRSSLNKLRQHGIFRGFPYVFLRDAVQIKGVGELSHPLIQYEQDSKMKQRLTIFMISMMVSGTLGSFFELLRHRAIEHKKESVSDSIKAVCHHVMTTQKSHRPFFLIYPLIISIKTAFFLPRSLNKDHQTSRM